MKALVMLGSLGALAYLLTRPAQAAPQPKVLGPSPNSKTRLVASSGNAYLIETWPPDNDQRVMVVARHEGDPANDWIQYSQVLGGTGPDARRFIAARTNDTPTATVGAAKLRQMRKDFGID